MKCLIDDKCPEILRNLCTVQMATDVATPYSCILNKYDPSDRSNKCRIIQLLNRANQAYFVYTRWGKLDTARKETLDCYLNLDFAVAAFRAKFLECTGIPWDNRLTDLAERPGFYNFIVMNYNIDEIIPETIETPLAPPVESLMTRIFDMDLCRNTQIDESKQPLGMLSLTQIKKAYDILREALETVDRVDRDAAAGSATTRYYSTIPTRKENTQDLNTREKIQSKLDFLTELENMYYIGKNHKLSIHSKYLSLNAALRPVPPETAALIESYLGVNHGYHQMKLKYREAFEIHKPAEEQQFRRWETLHNKQLLWHGTQMTNVVGILTNGLCINPSVPVAVTGKMFGTGLYFANVSTKSAGYLRISSGVGAMFLCEVALGNMYELKTAQQVTLPSGKHSVRGMGRYSPATDTYVNTGNDVTIPIGKIVESFDGLVLQYDEFIVYDQSQVKLRYLVLVDI